MAYLITTAALEEAHHMYACVCFSVTEEEITEEVADGACTEEALGERCGAGTSCGSCVERLSCLIERALRERDITHSAEAGGRLAALRPIHSDLRRAGASQ